MGPIAPFRSSFHPHNVALSISLEFTPKCTTYAFPHSFCTGRVTPPELTCSTDEYIRPNRQALHGSSMCAVHKHPSPFAVP